MKTTLEEAIRAYIVENLAYSEDLFADDTSLIGTGIIDSVGILELVTYLQNEFHVALVQQDITLEHFDSVNRIAKFVRGRRLDRAHAAD